MAIKKVTRKKNKPTEDEKKKDEPTKSGEEKGTPRYMFPRVSKCPRCKTTDTEQYSTKGDTQYRQCRRPICRKRYPVKGTPVE